MREAVTTFAEVMEVRLKANDYKGGWHPRQCTMDFLEKKLLEEVVEYIESTHTVSRVEELPDIANMAMMLWHRLNRTGLTK